VRRLEAAKGQYSAGAPFEYALSTPRGKLKLTWNRNAKALQETEQLEGVYVLKTNLPTKTHPLAQTLATYKEQTHDPDETCPS
jgi:hypothetical protein